MKFRYSLENLRGLAILFVMLSHFTSITSLGVVGKYVYFCLIEATSWFVFLSGYLFYHIESKRFDYASYMMKKLKFVILPYLILSIPAITAGIFFSLDKFMGLSPFAYVGWSLVVGGSVVPPMWFVPMIALFFLLSPLFNRLAKTRVIYVLAVVGIVFSLFSFRPLGSLNPFLSFLHFLGFYLLGLTFAVSIQFTDKVVSTGKTWLVVAPSIVVFLFALCMYEDLPRYAGGFFENFGVFNFRQLGKLSLLFILFFLFDRYFNQKNQFLSYFAEISFGLFFIHGFFMALFARLESVYVPPSPAINFLLEFLFVIVFSLLTVYVLKLVLNKRSRYVIGC
jgi:peptidoglycan/LPS O-acetylase OafA/YrhL